MNLTIRDIARMAGVSPATVSKIMNNYDGISEATRQKVYKIIEDTKYQPTFSAKSLATKKSNLIGLIYAGKINVDFKHPFFNEVMNTFKKAVGALWDMISFCFRMKSSIKVKANTWSDADISMSMAA